MSAKEPTVEDAALDEAAFRMDIQALDASMPVLLGSGSMTTTVSVHLLDRVYRHAKVEAEATHATLERVREGVERLYPLETRVTPRRNSVVDLKDIELLRARLQRAEAVVEAARGVTATDVYDFSSGQWDALDRALAAYDSEGVSKP